jgi:hypothetical protein
MGTNQTTKGVLGSEQLSYNYHIIIIQLSYNYHTRIHIFMAFI